MQGTEIIKLIKKKCFVDRRGLFQRSFWKGVWQDALLWSDIHKVHTIQQDKDIHYYYTMNTVAEYIIMVIYTKCALTAAARR